MVTDSIAAPLIAQPVTSSPPALNAEATQSFNVAFERARERLSAEPGENGLATMLSPLLALGEKSSALVADADPVLSSELRPSELLQITMQSHQFLFHCELVANVANRASDGVQHLFRQQS